MAHDFTVDPSGNIVITTGYTLGQLASGIHYETTSTNISGAVGALDFGGRATLIHTVTGDLSGSYTFPPVNLPALTQNATRAVLTIEYTQDGTGGRAIPLATLFANATRISGLATGSVDTTAGGKTRVRLLLRRIGGVVEYDAEFLPFHRHSNISVATQHSLEGGGDLSVAARTLNLVGDTASPGNHAFYKTDGAGARGWSTVALDNLSDAVITTPSNTQVLQYNGTNWVNAAAPGTVNITGGGDFVAVDTTAQMTAIASPTSGQVVFVRGRVTAYDGGGGIFYYHPTSSQSANGGTVFLKDAGGIGRWKRQMSDFGDGQTSGLFNVKWFSTPNEAVVAANAVATGGQSIALFFPDGAWDLGTVSVHHRLGFLGEGESAVLYGTITFVGGSRNWPPATRGVAFGADIVLDNCPNRMFENCLFYGKVTFGDAESHYNTFYHCCWLVQNQAILSTHDNNQNQFYGCRFLVPNQATLPHIQILKGAGWLFSGCAFEAEAIATTPYQPFLSISGQGHNFIGCWFERPDMDTTGGEPNLVFEDGSRSCTVIFGSMPAQFRSGVIDLGRGNTFLGAFAAGGTTPTVRGLRTTRSDSLTLTANSAGDVTFIHEMWKEPTIAIANIKGVTNRLVHFISTTSLNITFRVTDLSGVAAPGTYVVSFYLAVAQPS